MLNDCKSHGNIGDMMQDMYAILNSILINNKRDPKRKITNFCSYRLYREILNIKKNLEKRCQLKLLEIVS